MARPEQPFEIEGPLTAARSIACLSQNSAGWRIMVRVTITLAIAIGRLQFPR
jgi:hypothetical protein